MIRLARSLLVVLPLLAGEVLAQDNVFILTDPAITVIPQPQAFAGVGFTTLAIVPGFSVHAGVKNLAVQGLAARADISALFSNTFLLGVSATFDVLVTPLGSVYLGAGPQLLVSSGAVSSSGSTELSFGGGLLLGGEYHAGDAGLFAELTGGITFVSSGTIFIPGFTTGIRFHF